MRTEVFTRTNRPVQYFRRSDYRDRGFGSIWSDTAVEVARASSDMGSPHSLDGLVGMGWRASCVPMDAEARRTCCRPGRGGGYHTSLAPTSLAPPKASTDIAYAMAGPAAPW